MKFYIIRRLIYAVITLFIISIISFIIIQLPPGDATSIRLQVMQTAGTTVTEDMVEQLKADFGLDKPVIVQYFVWLKNMLQGNFGESFYYGIGVSTIIKDRFPNSLMLSFITILLVYAIAITGGIISAAALLAEGAITKKPIMRMKRICLYTAWQSPLRCLRNRFGSRSLRGRDHVLPFSGMLSLYFFSGGSSVEDAFFHGKNFGSKVGRYQVHNKFQGHGQNGLIKMEHLCEIDEITGHQARKEFRGPQY